MNAITHRVPTAQSDDPTDVVEALDVARALWDKGERSDAIRWVRRAVEAADLAGNVTRMASLARAAADLEQASMPPPAPMGRPSKPPPPLPAKARGASVPPPARSANATLIDPTPPPAVIPAAAPSAPTMGSAASETRSSGVQPVAAAPQASPVAATPPVAPPPAPSAPLVPPAAPSRPAVVGRAPHASPPQAAPQAAPQAEARIRVSLRKSARDPNLFVVRPLGGGQSPPPGTREAWLVMPDGPGEDGPKGSGP
jgi:hypothetical protein